MRSPLQLLFVPLIVLMAWAGTGSLAAQQPANTPASRGYLTTPQELRVIAEKAAAGLEPYRTAVDDVLKWANRKWDYQLDEHERCKSSNSPAWIDSERGVGRLYARALAYHLTGDPHYAEETKTILEQIMSTVQTLSLSDQQCRLNFGWGTPELVAAADLIEDYWADLICVGPLSTRYGVAEMGSGPCKVLFQNWLVKNPYYVVSYTAEDSQSNWGAAATTTLAYIADYLWDRPDVRLVHRVPEQINGGQNMEFTPAEAYAHANQLALDRMNGYRIDYHSSRGCDFLSGDQQLPDFPPVKSQITEKGIIPEDARREEACNIPRYNGEYQNYPQVHLGNVIQQCELMWRRGDRSCYDNIDMTDIPNYTYVDGKGQTHTTHLYPGRGSVERAIDAIIVDSSTEWKHDSALEVAYRYYVQHSRFGNVAQWAAHLNRPSNCSQDVCFGTLTHGFGPDETPTPPPTVAPPG
jgi:hypothetical protein